ncbi:Stress responsive protein [Ceraceosorus bombacis]|uniref:Stress responsive protein n=1 Tax=Ceraceosorus bombacis TaxID=401625 RepID=A0A0P1BR86_9BASI|nr:Stress responsive protein [Ceraceosorus bombacis]
MVKGSDILLCLVCILFPPAAAAFVAGCCSCDLLINVCLTILGYIPGHIHGFWLIYKKMRAEEHILGYIPGHIHGFWLIYKKMRAEEQYGAAYVYLGNGEYAAVDAAPAGAQPPNYGAAGNA